MFILECNLFKGKQMKIPRSFKTPDAVTLDSRILEEAKRQLLDYQELVEHSTKMVEYYQGVVNHLSLCAIRNDSGYQKSALSEYLK